MNDTVATLIATGLSTTLTHPGDGKTPAFPVPLQMFRTSSLPQEQREQYAQDAGLPHSDVPKIVGEAITALLETDYEILPKAEVAALRAAATAAEPLRNQRINLRCRCGTTLLTAEATNFDTLNPTVYGPPIIKYMQGISPECALGHGAI